MEQFLSSKWFSIALNVLSCAAVIIIGRYLAKKQKSFADSTGSYQLRAYIPTIWTSLGILGTFVSIAFSLLIVIFLGIDIDSLIRNIAPAFTTSIIGIIASIVASIDNKRYLALVEGEESDNLKRLNKEIANNRDSYSPDIIILEILKEIKNGHKESENNTGKLVNELSDLKRDTKASIEAHKASSEGKFDKLVTIVEKDSNSISNTIANALQKQKEDFEKTVSGLKSSFGTTLSEQNRILENKLNTLGENLRTSIESMNTRTEGIINRLVDATEKTLAVESEKRNNELKAFITSENKSITGFIEEQKKLYNSIKQNLEEIEIDMRTLFEEDVKQAIEKFAEEQHQVSVETLAQWNSKLVSDGNKSLGKHSEEMINHLSELKGQAAETYNSFKETINGIALTVESKLQTLYDQQTGLIEETINKNQKSINHALLKNTQSIEAILKANEEAIKDASIEIKSDNDNIKDELAAAQKRWKEEAESIEADHSEKVVAIYNKTESEIQDIQRRIIAVESALHDKLSGIKNEITNSITVFDSKLAEVKSDALDQNIETITELNKRIREAFPIDKLQNASDKLINGIGETLTLFDKKTSVISDSLKQVSSSISESSVKYADSIKDYDDKLGFIDGTLNTFKYHITSIMVLEQVLTDIKEAIQKVETIRGENISTSGKDKHKRAK